MIDQALHEKIENYLLGKMTPEETATFESDIQNDSELAKEVELHLLILPVPNRLAELDLRDHFQKWRREADPPDLPEPTSPVTVLEKRTIPLGWRWVGGLILLLLLAGVFLLWRYYDRKLEQEQESRKKSEQALLDANLRIEELNVELDQIRQDLRNASPDTTRNKNDGSKTRVYVTLDLAKKELLSYASDFDEAIRGTKSNTTPLNNRLSEANKAIQKKQYRKAERILKTIAASDQQYISSLEMLAYVYVQNNKFNEAVSAYKSYMKSDSDTDKTDWNLCVFYLTDYTQFKTAFQLQLNKILADPDHFYYSRAAALRQTLADKGIWPK